MKMFVRAILSSALAGVMLLCLNCGTLNGNIYLFRVGPPAGDGQKTSEAKEDHLYGPWFEYDAAKPGVDVVKKGETYTLFFDNAFFKYLPDFNNQNEVILVFTFEEGGSTVEEDRIVKIIGPMNRTADESLSSEISKISYGPKELTGDSLRVKVQVVEFDAEERENRGTFLDFVGQAAQQFNLANPVTAAEIDLAKEIAKTVNDFDQNDEVLTFSFELVPADEGVRGREMGLPLRAGHYGVIKQENKNMRPFHFTKIAFDQEGTLSHIPGIIGGFVVDVVLWFPISIGSILADNPERESFEELDYNTEQELVGSESRLAQRQILDRRTHEYGKSKAPSRPLYVADIHTNVLYEAILGAAEKPKRTTAPNKGEPWLTGEERPLVGEPKPAGEGDQDEEYETLAHECRGAIRQESSNYLEKGAPAWMIMCTEFVSREMSGWTYAAYSLCPTSVLCNASEFEYYGIQKTRIHPNDPYLRDVEPDDSYVPEFVTGRSRRAVTFEKNTRILTMGEKRYSNKTWITFSIEKGRNADLWKIRRRLSGSERKIIDMLKNRSIAQVLDDSKILDAIGELNAARQEAENLRTMRELGLRFAQGDNRFAVGYDETVLPILLRHEDTGKDLAAEGVTVTARRVYRDLINFGNVPLEHLGQGVYKVTITADKPEYLRGKIELTFQGATIYERLNKGKKDGEDTSLIKKQIEKDPSLPPEVKQELIRRIDRDRERKELPGSQTLVANVVLTNEAQTVATFRPLPALNSDGDRVVLYESKEYTGACLVMEPGAAEKDCAKGELKLIPSMSNGQIAFSLALSSMQTAPSQGYYFIRLTKEANGPAEYQTISYEKLFALRGFTKSGSVPTLSQLQFQDGVIEFSIVSGAEVSSAYMTIKGFEKPIPIPLAGAQGIGLIPVKLELTSLGEDLAKIGPILANGGSFEVHAQTVSGSKSGRIRIPRAGFVMNGPQNEIVVYHPENWQNSTVTADKGELKIKDKPNEKARLGADGVTTFTIVGDLRPKIISINRDGDRRSLNVPAKKPPDGSDGEKGEYMKKDESQPGEAHHRTRGLRGRPAVLVTSRP